MSKLLLNAIEEKDKKCRDRWKEILNMQAETPGRPSAFHLAVQSHKLGIVQYLLKLREKNITDPHCKNGKQETPLEVIQQVLWAYMY